MDISEIASAIIPSGKHAGKRIADLSRMELSGVYGAWNNIKVLKRKPFFKVLRAAVRNFSAIEDGAKYKQESLFASERPTTQEVFSAEMLLDWHLRNTSGFSMFAEDGKWVVSADKISGWITGATVTDTLKRAKEAVSGDVVAQPKKRELPGPAPAKMPALCFKPASITYMGSSARTDFSLPDSSDNDEDMPWE
jgi:predicted RNase H-like HicB family nuclease